MKRGKENLPENISFTENPGIKSASIYLQSSKNSKKNLVSNDFKTNLPERKSISQKSYSFLPLTVSKSLPGSNLNEFNSQEPIDWDAGNSPIKIPLDDKDYWDSLSNIDEEAETSINYVHYFDSVLQHKAHVNVQFNSEFEMRIPKNKSIRSRIEEESSKKVELNNPSKEHIKSSFKTKFENVFFNSSHNLLLPGLLRFLNIADSFSLVRTAKWIYGDQKPLCKHIRYLKIRQEITTNQRRELWMKKTKASTLKELYGDCYYAGLQINEGIWDKDIKKDIDRTFSHHKLFRIQNGQEMLFRILRGLSLHYPEIGYCQGMNFLSAIILLEVSEIEAFFIMMSMIKNYKFGGIYGENLKGTIELCKIFDWLIFVYHNDLYEYLQLIEVTSIQFFTQWCTGLFSCDLDPDYVFKILDLFVVDKWKIIFKISLAIIKDVKENLFRMPAEEVVAYLRHFSKSPTFNTKKVLDEALTIKLSNRLIENLWEIVASGKEIDKVMLIFDPKLGKKKWRVTFNGIDCQEARFTSSKPDLALSQLDTSEANTNKNFFASLLERFKLKF